MPDRESLRSQFSSSVRERLRAPACLGKDGEGVVENENVLSV